MSQAGQSQCGHDSHWVGLLLNTRGTHSILCDIECRWVWIISRCPSVAIWKWIFVLRSYHIIGWIFYKQAVIISKIGAQTWKEYVIDYWNVSEIRRSTLLNLVIHHCINSKYCQILSTQGAFTRYNTQDRVNIQDCNHVNKTTKITIARRVW
jgi:hypothetical protein